MGTTLKADDFVNVFKNPKEISVGISAQYIVMPLIALAIAKIFSLDTALTVGLVLVGTVPGGTASDVITFLSKGDVALSVSLTSVSTVISPILTPWITLLLIGNQIHFNPVDMFVSIIEIVIIPIVLGLILNYKFPDFCEKLKDYLPALSSIVICLIVAGVIGANKEAILTSSAIIIIVIVLQYFLAMILGFGVGYLAGMDKKQIVTVAIELAFQNSGLSTGLAKTHFPSLSQATVPGALIFRLAESCRLDSGIKIKPPFLTFKIASMIIFTFSASFLSIMILFRFIIIKSKLPFTSFIFS